MHGIIVAIAMNRWDLPWPLAILLGLGIGALVGAWQGLWVAYVGVPAFIVTLAGMLVFRGANQFIGNSTTEPIPDNFFREIGGGYLPELDLGLPYNHVALIANLVPTNSLAALFLSYPTFTVPFCTWLLIGFFKALPIELEEAALVDGATRLQALRRVLLPLAAPGIVAAAIFAFTLSWNEFLYALVFIQDERTLTVPVGLNLLIYGDVFHWGELMAASVITTVPVVTLYMFIHRWMVEGLAAGSVKG